MASKLENIINLLENEVLQVTSEFDNLKSFLRSAAWTYKYSFEEQILIYSQKPEAKAVASYSFWNNRMNRYINAGTKGIALIDHSGRNDKLKYVFDVSDTNSRLQGDVHLWKYTSEMQEEVYSRLSDSYDIDFSMENDIVLVLSALIKELSDDISKGYLEELAEFKDESSLKNFSNEEIEEVFVKTAQTASLYTALVRLGYEPDEYFDAEDFGEFNTFDTLNSIAIIGSAINDISSSVLREVELIVKHIEKRNEREVQNERNNLQERGRDSSAESVFGRERSNGDRGSIRQVRRTEEEVSDGTQEGKIFGVSDVGRADEPSGGSRPSGERENALSDAGSKEGQESSGQLGTADRMGESHEHEKDDGGRNGSEGTDLHLNREDVIDVSSEIDTDISDEEIDKILITGTGFVNGKYHVYKFFTENVSFSNTEAAEFLKKEYGIGGRTYGFSEDILGDVNYDAKGLKITKNNYKLNEKSLLLKWSQVADKVFSLIREDKYLSKEEKEEYRTFLVESEEREKRDIIAEELREFYRGLHHNTAEYTSDISLYTKTNWITEYAVNNDEAAIANIVNDLITIMDNTVIDKALVEGAKKISDKLLYPAEYFAEKSKVMAVPSYKIDDEVFIQGKWYIITQTGESVVLSNKAAPLLIKTFTKEDFEKSLLQSSLNKTLFKEVEVNEGLQETETIEAEPIENVAQKGETAKGTDETATEEISGQNYIITNDDLGKGTASEKYKANVLAIKTLKTLEKENRIATQEEQKVLSGYVGWGGLSKAFEEGRIQNDELKNLLTEDEYIAARESTLTAFYTPPVVIKEIYNKLKAFGFKKGNILEPSCGTGNFFGLMPENISKTSNVYGVELDSISGRIAQKLYPNNSIQIRGYENTNLADNFFDVAVGNVPFGQFRVLDKRYDKHNFMIHDYFFAKTLDKVRPGGVIVFITSKGTMDKLNGSIRRYIAQRAELLGAVRLPDNTFLANAGTEPTSDILFLQKRDRILDITPEWVGLSDLRDKNTGEIITLEDGTPCKINSYFAKNPDMILGKMTVEKKQYGRETTTCKAHQDADLAELLKTAFAKIEGKIEVVEEIEDDFADDRVSIPANMDVKNYSYTIHEGKVYFRENSEMLLVNGGKTRLERIKGLIELRDCLQELIALQLEDYPDEDIKKKQEELNALYDAYTEKYDLINSKGSSMAFSEDSSYFLLCSLENLDDNGGFLSKAAIFTKRTIGSKQTATSVDTPSEALALSIAEKAKVDIAYMQQLCSKSEEEIVNDLNGIIFFNPMTKEYETADEYLSGNVREKLEIAKDYAKHEPQVYKTNVIALEKSQPVSLSASEISIRLGATWIDPEIIKDFTVELLELEERCIERINVAFSNVSGSWNVTKNVGSSSVKARNTYGTSRVNAYKIIEDTLNLKDVRVYDYKYDEDGRRVQTLNQKETTLAQQKQELIKDKFQSWIWEDPERRAYLTEKYNKLFNSIRPREYDGEHISFNNMSPDITLMKHQKDAVARILYGGNTLLGHVVGAGKTFSMVAAAMESKRLGLCEKSLFVVPNHLTQQWATDFLKLYPSANILVARKKDFETKNRKKFCARIATGEWDAVIIGHTQFEKIPMSIERQIAMVTEEIETIELGIKNLKESNGERFSIKQMEKSRKNLKNRLEKLNDNTRKDDVVTFEQLGIDRLFVDEAHYYKNLFLYTKMRNVGGIAQTEAQKSTDMYMKTRYLSELTNNRGVIFATGTPVSNSMTELYTMQRYLQYDHLKRLNLLHFDSWASTFGETVTAIELAPEGTGYRTKTRFSKFYNLPELMSIFKEVADIKTADMLNLPLPKAIYHNFSAKPSEEQKEIMKMLSERADKIRNREVDSNIDNMLLVTSDGKKVALDQRILNDELEDFEGSKVNICRNNIYDIWDKTSEKKLTQLVFCDMSTPNKEGRFDVYNDLKQKLIVKGVHEDEIAFIHDATTDKRKEKIFEQVRNGKIRILFGSTFKMGAGTNVQDRLISIHDLDCPWRPSDLEQRSGRIIRQGNQNHEVHILRYVTEDTFDAYLWQTIENKQKIISQIMTGKSAVRSVDDIDDVSLLYAEVKALATGNPLIKEKMDLDILLSKLKTLKAGYLSQKYALQDDLLKTYPVSIKKTQDKIEQLKADIDIVENNTINITDGISPMTINGISYTDKKEAGAAIERLTKDLKKDQTIKVGTYRGLEINLLKKLEYNEFTHLETVQYVVLKGKGNYSVQLGKVTTKNITKIEDSVEALKDVLNKNEKMLLTLQKQQHDAEIEVNKPFEHEEEMNSCTARLAELNLLLDKDSRVIEETSELEKAKNPIISASDIEKSNRTYISKDMCIDESYGKQKIITLPENFKLNHIDCSNGWFTLPGSCIKEVGDKLEIQIEGAQIAVRLPKGSVNLIKSEVIVEALNKFDKNNGMEHDKLNSIDKYFTVEEEV